MSGYAITSPEGQVMRLIATIFAAVLAAMSFTQEADVQINFAVEGHGLMPTGGFETDFGAGVGVTGIYPMNDDGLKRE